MDAFRLYLHSVKMLVKCQLQYRTSFVLQTISQLVMMAGEMLAVVLIIDRFFIPAVKYVISVPRSAPSAVGTAGRNSVKIRKTG